MSFDSIPDKCVTFKNKDTLWMLKYLEQKLKWCSKMHSDHPNKNHKNLDITSE